MSCSNVAVGNTELDKGQTNAQLSMYINSYDKMCWYSPKRTSDADFINQTGLMMKRKAYSLVENMLYRTTPINLTDEPEPSLLSSSFLL
jgi:hypothetical protein